MLLLWLWRHPPLKELQNDHPTRKSLNPHTRSLPYETGLSPNTIIISCRCSRCRKQKIKCSGLQPCEGCKKRKVPCNFDDNETKVVVSRAYMRPLLPECQPLATTGVLKEVFQVSPGPTTEKWSLRTQPPAVTSHSRGRSASRTVRISRRRRQRISPLSLSSRR